MRTRFPSERHGFTLLEILLAIFVFSLVISAIYTTWLTILRGSKVGLEAAAAVQRSRIAMGALEDAFTTSSMFVGNIKHYAFSAAASSDLAEVSMVSRLPAGFPGVGRYGDAVVRRVTFRVEAGADGNELAMYQAPMLQDTNAVGGEPYKMVLAKDVTLFLLEFLDLQEGEWVTDWEYTNRMPAMVKIALGLGRSAKNSSDPQDFSARIVAIPSVAVQQDVQGGGMPVGLPFQPGVGQPGQPGQPDVLQPPLDPRTGRPIRNPNDPRFRQPGGFNPNQGRNPGSGFPR